MNKKDTDLLKYVYENWSQIDLQEYMDMLRDSGETNMFGATPYLMTEFELTEQEAKLVTRQYMRDGLRGQL